MDIEQLKLILEMVGAAGEGVSTLVVAWLVVGFAESFITPTAFLVFVVLAARLTRYGVDKHCAFTAKTIAARRIAELEYFQREYPHTARAEAEKSLDKALGTKPDRT